MNFRATEARYQPSFPVDARSPLAAPSSPPLPEEDPQRLARPPASDGTSLVFSFGQPSNDSKTDRDPLLPRSKKRMLSVQPESGVYSAILFLPAISRLQNEGKETNRNARLALFLVMLNALLQLGVVQVIDSYDYIYQRGKAQSLLNSADLQDYSSEVEKESLTALGEAQDDGRKTLLLPNEQKMLDSAKSISPLCQRDGEGRYNCVPHSVKFVHEWENLDTDGDGVWTLEEAKADKAHLKKKHHGVSPETIFNNVINGLRMNRLLTEHRGKNRTFYLPPDVDYARAIPRAYFNYWKGDAMICSLFDPNSCEAAAQAGIFKAALLPGRVSSDAKGIHDLDSAIQYCYRMLSEGGGCETLLPVDFKQNREQRWEMCGTGSFVEGGKYTNPYAPEQSVHVLQTTYESVGTYERASSRLYLGFQILIIMLWLLAIIDEFRELIKFGEFLIMFPGIRSGSLGGVWNKGGGQAHSGRSSATNVNDDSYNIDGITRPHRLVLTIVFLLRLTVINILANFGTRFLLVETSYLNLVLNVLALTFVLSIDSMLFSMVEKDVDNEIQSCKELVFETRMPSEGIFGYFLKKECWGLFLVPCLAVFLVLYIDYRDKEPLLRALKCTCEQAGSQCLDSASNQATWWDHYWSGVLPAAMHQVEALRIGALAGAPGPAPAAALAMAPARAPAVAPAKPSERTPEPLPEYSPEFPRHLLPA